ncbi:O-antigen ligase family protein [Cryomorphaceae bacterium]|nr:O-antigen ligase family protein [Cryomorphaceae bacterium]
MRWDKELKTRLYFYSLVFFAATMPFQRWVPPTWGLIVFWAAWLLQYPWSLPKLKSARVLFAGQMGLVFLIALGAFLSDHPSSAWDEFGRMTPLFFAPLSVALGPRLSQRRIDQIFDIFAWSVVLSLLLSLGFGCVNYLQFKDTGDAVSPLNYLFYSRLSFFLEQQAAYTALYALFALGIFTRSSAYGTMKKFAIFFLTASLFLLASRTQIALLVLLFPLWLILQSPLKSPRQSRILLVLFVLGFTAALLAPPMTRKRVLGLGEELSSTLGASSHERINSRWYLWTTAAELWSERPLLGWGTHEAERLLSGKAIQQLQEAADTIPPAAVVQSDLQFREAFLRDFYPWPETPPVYLDASNTVPVSFRATPTSTVDWKGEEARFKNDSSGFVGLAYTECTPGHLYRIYFEAFDRTRGGVAVWHNKKAVTWAREKAAGAGLERDAYFVAGKPKVEFLSSKYMASDVRLRQMKIWDLGPVTPSQAPVPKRLDNALEVYDSHFNTHNQYLQIGIDYGWIGVLLFLGIFIFIGIHAVREKNWVLVVLVVALMGSMMTEHMLLRETGLFFYAFWLSFATYFGLGWKAIPEGTPDEHASR